METEISNLLQSKHSGCWSNILEKEARPCVLGGRIRVVFQDEHLRKVLCYQVGKYFLTQKIYCHSFTAVAVSFSHLRKNVPVEL